MEENSTNLGLTPLTTIGYEFIKANKGTTLEALAKGINCSTRTAARIKVDLLAKSLIFTNKSAPTGKRGQPAILLTAFASK